MNYEVQGEVYTGDDEPYRLNIPYNPQAGTSEYVGEGIELKLQGGGDTINITSGYVRLFDGEPLHITPDRVTDISLPESNGMNYIYIQYDSSSDSTWTTQTQYHIDTDDTPPTLPSLKIGEIDTSTGTVTQLNRTSGATFENVVMGRIDNVEQISKQADLPKPTNGTITLDTATGYKPNGFVFVDTPFELQDGQPAPFLGSSGGLDGFVYTGGGTMIQGSGPLFMDDIYMHAPGGTLFGVAADSETEMYIKDTSFSDAVNQGDMASLGVIDGYRVQTFKGVNFENFQEGITLTGLTSKSFFEGCPIRNITASGVTIVQTDTDYQGELLKLSSDCYIKSVQSDTEVVRVPAGGEPSNYFKYYNVDHPDGTVTKANILNGEVGQGEPGTIVRNSFPLADTTVAGDLTLDSQQTITGSGAGPTEVNQGTWTLNLAQKVSNPSPGVLQFDAKADRNIKINARITIIGVNTEFALWVAKNGTVIDRSRVEDSTSATTKPTTVQYGAQVPQTSSDTPDKFSLYVENIGGAADLDAVTVNMEIHEA